MLKFTGTLWIINIVQSKYLNNILAEPLFHKKS